MSEADDDRKFWRDYSRVMAQDDVEEFMQVIRLGGFMPKIWFRVLGPDFMAECSVQREGAKKRHRLTATGPTRAATLEALAGAVAAYLFPDKKVKR